MQIDNINKLKFIVGVKYDSLPMTSWTYFFNRYDSFLIDYDMNDCKEFLNEVRNIIEFDGKFPIRMSRGINYHKMEKIATM